MEWDLAMLGDGQDCRVVMCIWWVVVENRAIGWIVWVYGIEMEVIGVMVWVQKLV